ncbi:MAG: 4-(cytidine 5'-diphospho)-2-C-methyl-D-erythritol kinase, partial [Cyanobacteria bacterium P01_A01_bin.135]
AKLGSDIPFCISGGTALATGRGERLSPLPSFGPLYLVLAKHRQLAVSTAWAYQTYRQQFGDTYIAEDAVEERHSQIHAAPLIAALMKQDARALGEQLYNDLEKVILPAHAEVLELKAALEAQNPLGVLMSGSGPTVFALVSSPDEAKRVAEGAHGILQNPEIDFWITRGCPTGAQLVG